MGPADAGTVGFRWMSTDRETARAPAMIQQTLFDGGLTVFSAFIGNPIELRSLNDRRRAAQLALLSLLLEKPDGIGSTDDIVRDRGQQYPDNAKWLGKAINELSKDGLIEHHDAARSKRKSRNGGLLNVWRIGDRSAAIRKVALIKATLVFTNEATSPAGTDEAANSQTQTSH